LLLGDESTRNLGEVEALAAQSMNGKRNIEKVTTSGIDNEEPGGRSVELQNGRPN